MKKSLTYAILVIIIIILSSYFLCISFGLCGIRSPKDFGKGARAKITNLFKKQAIEETAGACKLLCRKDADSYCKRKRTIEINNVYVTGTCRAFARNNNVKGFERCRGFCSTYDDSGTYCELNGEKDDNCDGTI
jgi:hypothetical protein